MISLDEKKFDIILHDLVKVIGCLKEIVNECPSKSCAKIMTRYEKVLMGIREALLRAIIDNNNKEKI